MELTKKTSVTITTTTDELRANLTAYQSDMLQEIVAEVYRNDDNRTVNWRDVAKFGLICMQNGKEFAALVEKTGTPWIDTPKTTTGWIDVVSVYPYVFGITDEVITTEVQQVIITLDGIRHDVSGDIINNL